MSNSPSRVLSVSQLSPRSSRWLRPTKAVGRVDRYASIQHTIRERFQTGKQLELTLERLLRAGERVSMPPNCRNRREMSTSRSSFALYERKDDVNPGYAVCDDV